jgi:hypothetical protein
MTADLISKRTRKAFREYFVDTTLRIISDAFDSEDITWDRSYEPPDVYGQRRTLVEQYYHSVDWKDPSSVARVLRVFESALLDLSSGTTEEARKIKVQLVAELGRDGIPFENGRLQLPAGAAQTAFARGAAARLELPVLQRQIDRITGATASDPAHAVGTAKEMIETTCKSILSARGLTYSSGASIPELVKQARTALKLLPEDIPDSARGVDTIRQLLSQLGSIAQNVAELRGLYGTGHGKEGKAKGLQPRHARLVVGAAAALATFLLETHEEREATPSRPPVS